MPEEPAQTPFNPGPEEPGQIPTHPVSGGAGQTPPIPVPEEPGQTPPSPVAPGCTPSANAPASAPGKTPAVDHDWVFKNLVQDYPQAALAFFAAGEKIGLDDDIEITFLGQEPPEEQMTEGKQILDVPMRVRWRDGSREDLVILLEEETIPSRFNPERLLSYTVRVMRREGTRRALPIVICLERGKMEAQLSLGGDHLHPLQFRIPHWHLASMDAAAYAESPNILARIMTVMMRYPHTPEARVRVYGQAWKGILALEPDPDRQIKQLGIMELYLTLNTEERQLLGQQYPQEKQRMNQLTARWYEEGRIDGQLKTLIRLLTRRFGTLDKATEARLQGATQGELDRWTDSILTARTLEEVFRLQ
jgi:hypothetical protein